MEEPTPTTGHAVPARRRDAAATRAALLSAARTRFVRFGYDRTTLRDVAADAGVNLALVKRYFGSKEGLFKASLDSAPRFLGRDGAAPHGREELARALAEQLAARAWPEFGEHPVLMLLAGSGDAEVNDQRREILARFARQMLDALDLQPGESGDLDLRAQLLLALGVGVAVLRSGVGLEPLGSADAASLEPAIRDVLGALIRPEA